MTFADSRELGPGRETRLTTVIIRWLPHSIRAAAVVALVALAATIEWPDTRASDQFTDQTTGQQETGSEPVFDGRGKWGGYAR